MRHRHQAKAVKDGAADQHAAGAILVGNHPRERLRYAPPQVLHRERQGKGLAPPVQIRAHWLQEQPEAVTYAHRERENQSAANENGLWSSPGRGGHREQSKRSAVAIAVGNAMAKQARMSR